MRITITIEDSQPLAVGVLAPTEQNHEAENAGAALSVAAADQSPPSPTDRTLTEEPISAGPAADPLTEAEPIFLAETAVARDLVSDDDSGGSADFSAGPAPAAI